jgi:hypothetical protein
MATKSSQVRINPAKKGLYSNIDAKRKRIAAGSGEKMRKPGSPGAPTNANFRAAAKTAKRNPIGKSIAGEHLFNLGSNYFAAVTLTGYNDYYAQIFYKTTDSSGFTEEQIVPDYKPRHFSTAKAAINSVMKYASKNKLKSNPITETLIYGLPLGEKRDYMEELLYAGGQLLNKTQIQQVFDAASAQGWHSFRVVGFDPTVPPNFMKAIKSGKKTTRTNPSKRSSSRSAVVQNPAAKKPKKVYTVSIMQDGLHTKFMGLANFFTFAEAENYSRYLAKQHPNWSIRVHDNRAMK